MKTVRVKNNHPCKVKIGRVGGYSYEIPANQTRNVDASIIENLSKNAGFRYEINEGWIEFMNNE